MSDGSSSDGGPARRRARARAAAAATSSYPRAVLLVGEAVSDAISTLGTETAECLEALLPRGYYQIYTVPDGAALLEYFAGYLGIDQDPESAVVFANAMALPAARNCVGYNEVLFCAVAYFVRLSAVAGTERVLAKRFRGSGRAVFALVLFTLAAKMYTHGPRADLIATSISEQLRAADNPALRHHTLADLEFQTLALLDFNCTVRVAEFAAVLAHWTEHRLARGGTLLEVDPDERPPLPSGTCETPLRMLADCGSTDSKPNTRSRRRTAGPTDRLVR